MKLVAFIIAAGLVTGHAFAAPLDDAQAGRDALGRGDTGAAVRLLSAAIDSGGLSPDERERALVSRAEAYLAGDQAAKAVADANEALRENAGDPRAIDVRTRARASIMGQGSATGGTDSVAAADLNGQVKAFNDGVAARNQATKAAYEDAQASYEARKKADADAYAAQVSTYEATIRSQDQQHAAELAAWRERVAACKQGDFSKCDTPAGK